jgi:hypothetical protein
LYGDNNLKKKLLILFAVLFVVGCLTPIVSIEDYTKNWIGRPIEETKKLILRPESYASRIGWKEKTYQLNNGNWVYVEPDSKNCFIHWEVNPQGIIVGYKLEGKCY